uniref:GTP-binding protein n=1 Tax=Neobodo designis TaxID=312471 RepID=A0A7S1MIM7_NEODS|mmetsp:Transcript_41281/g.127530  ORF Transcript_41281/g.127530 Transcript_41281/m.127530 type:complete len:443 (+) Transcript_41281:183-1511(+)
MQRITLSSASLQRAGTPSSRSATPTTTPTVGALLSSPVTRLPRADLGRCRQTPPPTATFQPGGHPHHHKHHGRRRPQSDTTRSLTHPTTSDDPDDETGSIASVLPFYASAYERDAAEPHLRFSRGLVVDAADLVVEFLGPGADSLRLSLTNSIWGSIVRTSDVWLAILEVVAPFSTRAVRRGYAAALQAGSFSTRVDWVCHLAVAWRRQLELNATVATARSDPLRQRERSFIARAGWWATAPLQLVAAPFRRRHAPQSVVVTGSLMAGKKTFVSRLGEALGAERVSGAVWQTVACPPNWQVVVTEVIGYRRIRPLLQSFFNAASALICVVDASRPTDIDDFARELDEWIQTETGRCPICVIANQLDRPGALSTESVVERLGLQTLGLHLFNGEGYPAPSKAHLGGRHVAAIGTCLTHELVGHGTVTSVMQWLETAVNTQPPA